MHNKQKWLNVLRTAWQFVSTTVIAFVTMVAVLFVGVRIAGLQMFSVETGSMYPEYPKDALVLVKKVEPQTLKNGDVITFVLNEEGALATHRIVEVDSQNSQFYTKGDANNSRDPRPVIWDNIVGQVVFGIPKLGAPVRYLTAEGNRTKIIVALAVVGVISFAWDIIGDKLKKRKEQQQAEAVFEEEIAEPIESLPSYEKLSPGEQTDSEDVYKISDRKKEDIIYKF